LVFTVVGKDEKEMKKDEGDEGTLEMQDAGNGPAEFLSSFIFCK
jgi:hypothetical protein